ncbi:pentapeptide repeat-containing protein [Oerskovia enterophila]|uniref:pentapeptide repeat-containing protein n=1 Tax=Oerskovia enterophila TaxID=43678 RepID=UPI0033915CDA
MGGIGSNQYQTKPGGKATALRYPAGGTHALAGVAAAPGTGGDTFPVEGHGRDPVLFDRAQHDLRTMSREELAALDLRGADLSGVDLSGLDLSYKDLSGANLQRANLHAINLEGTTMWRADLNHAIFSDRDLRGSNQQGIVHDESTTPWKSLKARDKGTSSGRGGGVEKMPIAWELYDAALAAPPETRRRTPANRQARSKNPVIRLFRWLKRWF